MSQEIDRFNDGSPKEREESTRLMGQALPYYLRFMFHVARVTDPASPSHPSNLRDIGSYYRTLRKERSLLRLEVAERASIDVVQLFAFEGGLVPLEDLPEDFVNRLSGVLNPGQQPQGPQ